MMFRLSTTCFYISFEVWDRKTEKKNVFMTQESQFVICNPTFCLQNFFLKLDLWNQFILLSPCSPPLPHVHNIHWLYHFFLSIVTGSKWRRQRRLSRINTAFTASTSGTRSLSRRPRVFRTTTATTRSTSRGRPAARSRHPPRGLSEWPIIYVELQMNKVV